MEATDWKATAKNILKSELTRKGVDYEELVKRLNELGIADENYNSVCTKINRGTFTFQFFLQCMRAIDVSDIRLN
jgi:hypothetical protein